MCLSHPPVRTHVTVRFADGLPKEKAAQPKSGEPVSVGRVLLRHAVGFGHEVGVLDSPKFDL